MTPNEWKQFRALLGMIEEAAGMNAGGYNGAAARAKGIEIAQKRYVGALTAAIERNDPHYIREAVR